MSAVLRGFQNHPYTTGKNLQQRGAGLPLAGLGQVPSAQLCELRAGELAALDLGAKQLVVCLVLVGVRPRELPQGVVEGIAVAQIGCDGHTVSGARRSFPPRKRLP